MGSNPTSAIQLTSLGLGLLVCKGELYRAGVWRVKWDDDVSDSSWHTVGI